VAVGCAIAAGLIAALVTSMRHAAARPAHPFAIGGAVALAMFWAVVAATFLGIFLPFLFRRIGVDPAIASGPFVTTGNDAISVLIYLSLAHTLLH